MVCVGIAVRILSIVRKSSKFSKVGKVGRDVKTGIATNGLCTSQGDRHGHLVYSKDPCLRTPNIFLFHFVFETEW